MSSFTDPLYITPFDDKMVNFMLTQQFTYEIGELGSNEKVVVPVGFVTDFATTWPFDFLIPRQGTYGKAAVVHDYLCTFKMIKVNGVDTRITRKKGDQIFLEAMGVSKVNPIVKYLMYGYVRLYAIIAKKE